MFLRNKNLIRFCGEIRRNFSYRTILPTIFLRNVRQCWSHAAAIVAHAVVAPRCAMQFFNVFFLYWKLARKSKFYANFPSCGSFYIQL